MVEYTLYTSKFVFHADFLITVVLLMFNNVLEYLEESVSPTSKYLS